MVAPQLQIQIQVRELCPRCYGTGRLGVATPYCGRCHRDFTAALVATMVRQVDGHRWQTRYRGQKRLLCRHRIAYLRWTDPTCNHCDGQGGQLRWVPLDWVLRVHNRLQSQGELAAIRPAVTTRPLSPHQK